MQFAHLDRHIQVRFASAEADTDAADRCFLAFPILAKAIFLARHFMPFRRVEATPVADTVKAGQSAGQVQPLT